MEAWAWVSRSLASIGGCWFSIWWVARPSWPLIDEIAVGYEGGSREVVGMGLLLLFVRSSLGVRERPRGGGDEVLSMFSLSLLPLLQQAQPQEQEHMV